MRHIISKKSDAIWQELVWRDVRVIERDGKFGFAADCWRDGSYLDLAPHVAFSIASPCVWPSAWQAEMWGEAECALANAGLPFSNLCAVVGAEPEVM